MFYNGKKHNAVWFEENNHLLHLVKDDGIRISHYMVRSNKSCSLKSLKGVSDGCSKAGTGELEGKKIIPKKVE